MSAVRIIGIAGPSGSGKSELARHLAAETGAPVVSLDCYYRDLSHMTFAEREQVNFDEPDSIEHELLMEHCSTLLRGEPAAIPHYDFSRHTRAAGVDLLTPKDLVIVEGLFTLWWKPLRKLLQLSVYVDLEDEICFARRLRRDVIERGRTEESVRHVYEAVVRPMAERYIWPTRRHAAMVIRGDSVLEESVATIRTALG